MTASALDDGARARARSGARRCCSQFGSLKRLRAATVEEIAEVPGHRPAHRARRSSRRWPARPAPAARPSTSTTGEILD